MSKLHVLSRNVARERALVHEEKGVLVCKMCHAVHFRKAWRHDDEFFRRWREFARVRVEETVCPACKLVRFHQYNGKIVFSDLPKYVIPELTNLIIAYGKRAWRNNPEDRVVEIVPGDHALTVTTTEDQLAVRIAKKVRDAFKRFTIDIHYAKDRADETLVRLRFTGEARPAMA